MQRSGLFRQLPGREAGSTQLSQGLQWELRRRAHFKAVKSDYLFKTASAVCKNVNSHHLFMSQGGSSEGFKRGIKSITVSLLDPS